MLQCRPPVSVVLCASLSKWITSDAPSEFYGTTSETLNLETLSRSTIGIFQPADSLCAFGAAACDLLLQMSTGRVLKRWGKDNFQVYSYQYADPNNESGNAAPASEKSGGDGEKSSFLSTTARRVRADEEMATDPPEGNSEHFDENQEVPDASDQDYGSQAAITDEDANHQASVNNSMGDNGSQGDQSVRESGDQQAEELKSQGGLTCTLPLRSC